MTQDRLSHLAATSTENYISNRLDLTKTVKSLLKQEQQEMKYNET